MRFDAHAHGSSVIKQCSTAFHQQASAELMDQEAVQDILPNKVLLHPAHSRTRARTRVAEFISFQKEVVQEIDCPLLACEWIALAHPTCPW